MRGLTLWQPMAWAIAEGHKPVENRVWPLPARFVGQRFAVHAGKKYDEPWARSIRERFGLDVPAKAEISLGAVVAVATFSGCLDDDALEHLTRDELLRLGLPGTKFNAVYEWYSGPYGFLLRDVRKLAEPVPCRGFQGLWTLPPEVESAVIDQVGAHVPQPPPSPASAISDDELATRFRATLDADGNFTPRDLLSMADALDVPAADLCGRLESLELLAAGTTDHLREGGLFSPSPVQASLLDPEDISR